MSFEPRIKAMVKAELDKTSLTDMDIMRQLGCATGWLRAFKAGYIKSPNVDRMEQLYFILTGRHLVEVVESQNENA